eukprot:TRINITY_DN5440_c0_g1_i1.p1 TRINITY_DN5440_c0_g1~~TRINITY_DN5440_c0_g1_i1.p1  ORF type:complete len:351 (+),score=38.01 TRINITY_DN5440_c0_g1_i1:2-1054(+)
MAEWHFVMIHASPKSGGMVLIILDSGTIRPFSKEWYPLLSCIFLFSCFFLPSCLLLFSFCFDLAGKMIIRSLFLLLLLIGSGADELQQLRHQREVLEKKAREMREGTTRMRSVKVSDSPRIFMIDDFLTQEECEYVIGVGKPLLKKSKMYTGVSSTPRTDNDYRRSQSYTDKDRRIETDDKKISDILQRMHEHAFLPIEYGENLQLAHYGPGDYYQLHRDTIPSLGRYSTFLVYLNNVTSGGETIFPGTKRKTSPLPEPDWNSHQHADITSYCESDGVFKVVPKAGRAVFFFSMNPDMTVDKYALHGACPVQSGEKWVLQRWMRHFTDNNNNYYNTLWLPRFPSLSDGIS